MNAAFKSVLIGIVIVGAISVAVWAFRSANREQEAETWRAEHEGYLAVEAPGGVELRRDLNGTRPSGPGVRPATAAEALTWIDAWPYRVPGNAESPDQGELRVAAKSREVRCTGTPTGESVPQRGDEVETIEALRTRLECTYAKWMVWSGETATERPNERHTVWADEDGRFRGRVDYWR